MRYDCGMCRFLARILLLAILPYFLRSPAAFATGGPAPSGNNGETNYNIAFPMNVAGTAAFLAFDNPPLPILQNRKGNWKVSLQPALIKGDLNRTSPFASGGGSKETGKYSGVGGATSLTYGFSDHWSVYLLAFGSSIKGDADFVESGNPASSDDPNNYRISKVKASFLGVGPALAYRWGRPKDRGVTWSSFFGVNFVQHHYTATVHEFSPAGTLLADYDVKVDQTNPGPIVGLQAGIPIGESFTLNPFLMLGGDFGSTTKPTVTAQRTPASGTGSSKSLGFIAAGQGPIVSQGAANLGLNVTYRPWGLTVNVTAPFLATDIPVDKGGEDIRATEISVSWSFGDYIK